MIALNIIFGEKFYCVSDTLVFHNNSHRIKYLDFEYCKTTNFCGYLFLRFWIWANFVAIKFCVFNCFVYIEVIVKIITKDLILLIYKNHKFSKLKF